MYFSSSKTPVYFYLDPLGEHSDKKNKFHSVENVTELQCKKMEAKNACWVLLC